jgi:16S rRNA (uracil1498-N3)-methyltransferase
VRHTFRYVVPQAPAAGDEVELSQADAHHLARVVRREPGDEVELIDPEGCLWPARVLSTEPVVTVRVCADRPPTRAPATRVALYLGLAEWGRVDTAVEKVVELGVEEVVLFTSERARRVPEPDAWRRRRERLQRVAEAAARQSGRGPLRRLRGLLAFDEVTAEIPSGEGFLIDPRGDAPLTSARSAGEGSVARVALVVGPDAGFSEGEVARARAAGLSVAHLGPAVLRAETAAIAAVTIAASAGWGAADG